MANQFGYLGMKSDLAGLWITGGTVQITGTPGTPSYSTVPSGIVRSVVRNDVGNYSIILQQSWYALVSVSIDTVIGDGYSPDLIHTQIESITVGDPAVLPVQAGGDGQSITFQCYNTSDTAEELDAGDFFVFTLILKQSSA